MKKICFIVLTFLFFFPTSSVLAVENPLTVSNNKFGIHILFPSELPDAAKLVNSTGGDWGYVTIPIQVGDKDLEKWQQFMTDAAALHLIPIIRLSTELDYFNTKAWRKPNDADIVDFANFLNSLVWPTKNRYIIVFNEVNRADEWGGNVNPAEYADILSFAGQTFKSIHQDFFIINAGLDNAAPNQQPEYMNQYDFLTAMYASRSDVFINVDGIASHAYPNPAFSQPPQVKTTKSIASFLYERTLIQKLSGKELPVFITETGWTSERIPDEKRAAYYANALTSIWADKGIVAITPFLLKAGAPFSQFSFIDEKGNGTLQYQEIQRTPKTKGKPIVGPALAAESLIKPHDTLPRYSFTSKNTKEQATRSQVATSIFQWIFKL